MNQYFFHPSSQRGKADYGWLKTGYSFSFANYFNPEMMGFGTLRVINDDWVAPDSGFGKHPHEDMEIVTIVFSGELSHTDSMGNIQTLKAGEVQAMSAGSRVFHSEYNASPDTPVTLFQIWIETREKRIPPQYNQRFFDASKRLNIWQLLVSPKESEESCYINQDAYISRTLLEAGKTLHYKKYRKENILYIMNISGMFQIDTYTLDSRDALGME